MQPDQKYKTLKFTAKHNIAIDTLNNLISLAINWQADMKGQYLYFGNNILLFIFDIKVFLFFLITIHTFVLWLLFVISFMPTYVLQQMS